MIILHELIHYAYKCCITYALHGEKRTNARNKWFIVNRSALQIRRQCMRRSKLEIELDILKILSQKGPLRLTHIMYKTNLNCEVLSKDLAFLKQQGVIEVRNVGRGSQFYSITNIGLSLLKSWKELRQFLSAVENENEVQPLFRNTVSVRM